MTDTYNAKIQSLANTIRNLATTLRYDATLMLHYTGLLLDRYIETEVGKYGQNASRLRVMHTLITHGGMLTQSDLTKMTFLSKQAVTKIIDSLEKDGMVERKLGRVDRRTREVSVTMKGLDIVRENLPLTLKISDAAMSNLSQAQMEELNAILSQIRKDLLPLIKNSDEDR